MLSIKKIVSLFFLFVLLFVFYLFSKAEAQAACTRDPSWKLASFTDRPTSVIFHLRLTNNCPDDNNFILSVTKLPTQPHNYSGWTWKFTNGLLNKSYTKIGVEGTVDVNLTVTRPANVDVPNGTYTPLTVKAALSDNSSVDKSIELGYIAINPTRTTAPAAKCDRNVPGLKVTPDTQIGAPGQELAYTVKVTNRDKAGCVSSVINLSASILDSSGWDYRFERDKVTFAAGVTKSTKLYVTSPKDSTSGPKTITIIAKRPNGPPRTFNVIYFIEAPIPTPTPSPTPTSTPTPEPTPTNVPSTPTPTLAPTLIITPNLTPTNTPIPTPTPSPTPTPTPTSTPSITPAPGTAKLNFRLGIDGIGTTPRIPIGGNKNPDNIFRGLNFRIYNAATNALNYTGTNITFTYNPTSEKFELLYELPSVANVADGLYNIYVDGPRFLRTQYPGSFSIKAGQTTNLTSNNFYLITGNINDTDLSENKIDLMDYNVLLSCSIYSQDLTACEVDPNYEDYSDLNDDGKVDLDDFTLWLKELANQEGSILPD